jgi:hypothetical protein
MPADEDDRILTVKRAFFFKSALFQESVYWLLCVLTAGLFHIVLSWVPLFHARFRYVPAADALEAGK